MKKKTLFTTGASSLVLGFLSICLSLIKMGVFADSAVPSNNYSTLVIAFLVVGLFFVVLAAVVFVVGALVDRR